MFEPEDLKNEIVTGTGDTISELSDEMTKDAAPITEQTFETPIEEPDPVEAAPEAEQEARPQEGEESGLRQAPVSTSDEPEPEDGEYHYKSGYTQRIYADAHYAPADESTVPPRYYTPPRRPSKVSPEKKPRKKGLFLKVACLCLVCALLGSVGGAALVGRTLNQRIAALEEAQENRPTVTIGTDSGSTKKVASTEISSGKPLAQLYEQACQQVVGITTEVTYQNFFGQTSTSAVSGSGFIISEDGYILTNYHVIEYADKGGYTISVMLHDGTRYEASIVGSEESNDIAVLKIDAAGLTPVTLGNSDAIKVGDEVHAVGNPLGELEFSMTNGHVSALDRVITTDSGGEAINMFQIDAPVNSGNSGGPVYDSEGAVIGIVTAKYSSSGVEGLGFAIPINDAVHIAEDLITKGYVTGKAYLGVTVETQYNAMYAQYYSMPLGAYIAGVEKNSCAEKAGLQAGDIITRVGETQVESYNDLKQALKAYSAGDTAELEIYRADKSTTVTVVFDEARPSN
ncbi:MAG: S1C family serine protease [Clostridia bacterium]